MTAMWIGIAVAGAAVLVWRLRRAAALLDRILREERDAARPTAAGDHPTPGERGPDDSR